MARKRKSKKPDFAEPVDDVECDSEFEDNYDIDDNCDNVEQQEIAEDICFQHSDAEEEDGKLKGGAHPLAEEEEESEDELLLTTKSTKALAVDIEQFKQKLEPKTKSK
uniref:Uncharacterized protein n=1 Tax=Ganoderma boninense TaxID=34458 RepID=A0A5K1K6Y3_9APHY|nr:Uncharacterized protein [Ganoderma boninense]